MRITSACIYVMNIPFVESFSHSLSERAHSDSILVKVTTDAGICGFGEGAPRSYVTGETRDACVDHVKNRLLPAVVGLSLDGIAINQALTEIDHLIPDATAEGTVVWNASRCAVELAILDCLFRANELSIGCVLPPEKDVVVYSAVIGTGSIGKAEMMAHRCKAMGIKHVKVKVSGCEDVERIAAVRNVLGSSVSMRVDANAGFERTSAIQFLKSVEKYDIDCIEQPLPRGSDVDMAALRTVSPIPLMADESIVTIQDARRLIEKKAVDYFNLRLSKCGGVRRTLAIADLARSAGVGLQLGCQVGETAILSAAGRHVAAHLKDLRFVEGSYGAYLLVEDVSHESVALGAGGSGSMLTGVGLGVTVREEILEKYAEDKITVC